MTSAPEHYICPLTLDVMNFPMLHLTTGKVFERAAILGWIYRGNATCPLTRSPIHPSELVFHTKLQIEIALWKEENPNEYNDVDDDGDDAEDDSESVDDYAVIQGLIANIRKNGALRTFTGSKQSEATKHSQEDYNRIKVLRSRVLKNREERIARYLTKTKSQGIVE